MINNLTLNNNILVIDGRDIDMGVEIKNQPFEFFKINYITVSKTLYLEISQTIIDKNEFSKFESEYKEVLESVRSIESFLK